MSAATSPDRYAVLGNPIAHSLSPFIHARFAEQTRKDMAYDRVLCPIGGFVPCVEAFVAAGGRGCNITMPFKHDAFALASRRSARATLAQAANVLVFGDDGAWADNTDGAGLLIDIERGAGFSVAGQRVLLIGAGGAAAGVLGPLLEARPAQLVVANRDQGKADKLVQRHQVLAEQCSVTLLTAPLATPGAQFDLVINASASSLQGVASPVPATTLRRGTLAVDLAYETAAMPFLEWANHAGAVGRDGLGMLVEQAALAFESFRGVSPATAPVLAELRRTLASAA